MPPPPALRPATRPAGPARPGRRARAGPRRAKNPAMNLASALAPVTMLSSSTASSMAWMLRARGP